MNSAIDTSDREVQDHPQRKTITVAVPVRIGEIAEALNAASNKIGEALKSCEEDGKFLVEVVSHSHSVDTLPHHGTYLTVIVMATVKQAPQFTGVSES